MMFCPKLEIPVFLQDAGAKSRSLIVKILKPHMKGNLTTQVCACMPVRFVMLIGLHRESTELVIKTIKITRCFH